MKKQIRKFKHLSFIDILFILCGGQFYLDWILPTNPQSKNIVIRFLWGNAKNSQNNRTSNSYQERFKLCFIYGGIHTVFLIIYALKLDFFSISNILINIYPVIVQLYIGYRIVKIMNHKKRIKLECLVNRL